MNNSIYRRALAVAAILCVGVRLAIGSNPGPSPPTTPPQIPTPTPRPSPQIADPPSTATPAPTPIATPTVPSVNPPPVSTPTIPPPISNILPQSPGLPVQPDPQAARAIVRYGQNNTLVLKNDRGRFQKVALQQDQVVTIVLTLSPKDFGKPAEVQLLDGGAMSTDAPDPPKPKDILPPTPTPYPSPTINSLPISSGPGTTPTPQPVVTPPPTALPDPSTLLDSGQLMTVSQAGEVIFHFKPGADIGLHRVSVVVGGNQYLLQFWRQNASAPNNNPRMLHAY